MIYIVLHCGWCPLGGATYADTVFFLLFPFVEFKSLCAALLHIFKTPEIIMLLREFCSMCPLGKRKSNTSSTQALPEITIATVGIEEVGESSHAHIYGDSSSPTHMTDSNSVTSSLTSYSTSRLYCQKCGHENVVFFHENSPGGSSYVHNWSLAPGNLNLPSASSISIPEPRERRKFRSLSVPSLGELHPAVSSSSTLPTRLYPKHPKHNHGSLSDMLNGHDILQETPSIEETILY
jgi:hypothetical protein